jgi:hypothetical protein
MKHDLTQIAVILDRSGSMTSCEKQTIDNFNEFVNQQKAQPGEARLRLVQFDDKYEFLYDKRLQDVEHLTDKTFVPRGMTALNDAIGRTCEELGRTLASMPDHERPGKVIVVILTDGCENNSTNYTKWRVAEIVKHQRDKYNWAFIFMGADEHAVLQAQGYNIPIANAIHYSACDPLAYRSVSSTMSGTVSTYRQTGALQSFTQKDRDDAAGNALTTNATVAAGSTVTIKLPNGDETDITNTSTNTAGAA